MQSIETEGRSIDDAIERALALLGAPRERVDIEILANAARGLFGFGGRRARVRATVRRPMGEAAEAAGPTSAADAAPLPADPADTLPVATRTSAPARPVGGRRRGAPRRASDEAPPRADVLERGRAVLAEIVRLCGSEATVAIDGARLVIVGDASGVLIGRRGTTLDALEYLVNRAVGPDEERVGHVELDANDYRARRRAALEALAQRMAERARSHGRPVSLDPLSPRERRVVHLALQDDPTLTTRSSGEGFYRRVTIVPTGPRPGA